MIKLSNKTIIYGSILFVISVCGLFISSCANRQYVKPSCILPSGVDLEEALVHSKKDLGHLECEALFDSYYERLIEIAKRDPDMQNRRKFSNFLEWANDAGIIDKIQALN